MTPFEKELDAAMKDWLFRSDTNTIDNGLNADQYFRKRVKQAVSTHIIGEDVRPIYSGHTFHCVYCGDIGGICEEDEVCTGDGGLNPCDENHRIAECRCERDNKLRAGQREALGSQS